MNIEDVRDVTCIELELRAYGIPPELIDEYETAITAHCGDKAVTYCEFDNEISGWNAAESAYLRAHILDDIDQRRKPKRACIHQYTIEIHNNIIDKGQLIQAIEKTLRAGKYRPL